MKVRKIVSLLLVAVVLSSIVSPALATSMQCQCNTISTEHTKVAVTDIGGLKRNEILAKVLEDNDVKKLMDTLIKKGYKPELSKAIIKRITAEYRNIVYVYIPFETGNNHEVGLGYLITNEGSRTIAVELGREVIRLYYVDTEGAVQEKVVQADEQVRAQGNSWDCAECGAAITLTILCCVGTGGLACYLCVIASGILAACDCIGCCCYLGYSACCDAEEEYCD